MDGLRYCRVLSASTAMWGLAASTTACAASRNIQHDHRANNGVKTHLLDNLDHFKPTIASRLVKPEHVCAVG